MLVFQKILRTYYMVNFIVLTLNNGVTCVQSFESENTVKMAL